MVENGDSRVLTKYAYYTRPVYAWPKDGESVTWKLFLICWTRAIFGGIIMYTGAAFYLYKAREGDPTNERMVIVWNILEVSVVIVETIALNFIKGNAFIAFLKKVNQYPFGKPDNIEKIDKRQERSLDIWYYTIKASCFVYILHNYIRSVNCDLRGITGDKRFICGLLLPTWFPIEMDYFPVKQLLLLYNVVSMWIFVPALGLGPPMVITSVELIVVRMKCLKKHIRKLKFGQKSHTDDVKQQFLWCIRYHEHIME
ncbi:hypothetical protein WA026_020572 [Henosepilachna vigintioctopunctata]|uniref:Odorant receptor n=1 Tax=Henosepilachna vigintioctopunctata TaxID=420089 RepID=A0AAW1UXE2_9CUCU